jgi:hypothetical protein
MKEWGSKLKQIFFIEGEIEKKKLTKDLKKLK